MRDELISVVERALSTVSPQVMQAHLSCFTRCLEYPPTCSPPGARALNANELRQADDLLASLATSFLEAYQCNWLEVGVRIANSACSGGPCSYEYVTDVLYETRLNALGDNVILEACRAIRTSAGGVANDVACTKDTPWFQTNGSKTLIEVIQDPAAQISLMLDIVEYQLSSLEQRTRVATSIVRRWENWSGATGRSKVANAKRLWTRLAASCAPSGCAILGSSTNADFYKFAGTVLLAWLSEFSTDTHGAVPGCSGAGMLLDEKRWQYTADTSKCRASSSCLRWSRPRHIYRASKEFAAASLGIPLSSDVYKEAMTNDLLTDYLAVYRRYHSGPDAGTDSQTVCNPSLDELSSSHDLSMTDPWGSTLTMHCGKLALVEDGARIAVISNGPDRKLGTEDDIRAFGM
jgi:hypothetical protein